MAKSFSELQTLAIQIRDELNKKKNSAQRVGSALLDIIDNCIQNITDIKQKLSVFEHACSGFKRVSSEAQLPVTPSQEDLAKGFLVNTSLYLYVGTGGNAVNGRYFNVGDIRGPQGEPGSKGETGNTGPTGEKGEQGNSGVTGDTSDIVVINNLDGGESEEGSIKVLAAEQGKVLNKKFTELDNKINSTFINVSHLFPTDGYTNEGSTGGDQYTLDEAIQLFVDKGLDDMLKASHGLIFVNKETKKWELWEFKFYTKIGGNYKTKSNFRKVITTDDYDELHNKIIMLQSGISKENIYNLQSVNLIKELVYRNFNVSTGDLGEEGSGSVAGAIINMRGIETTDVYFFTLGSFHSLFTTIYVYDEDGNYIQGGISYDENTSNEHLRHFIIPKGVSKIYTQYLSEESLYIQPIETHIPYGITDNSYKELIKDFYYLGKTLDSIEIDISRLFNKFKKEVYLKAGQTYRISSDYTSMPFRYLDVKGNDVTITLGATFIPEYDCFYIYNHYCPVKNGNWSLK